jgi:CheY-like chemotaxis protein
VPCALSSHLKDEPAAQAAQFKMARPVLVVEDSADTLSLLATLFAQQGCRVLAARSAAEALKLVAAERPEIIISDIGMPEMDGYELLARLRRLPGLEQIPAIAISGYAMEEDRGRALEAGFSAHIAKPVDPEELLRLVQRLTS